MCFFTAEKYICIHLATVPNFTNNWKKTRRWQKVSKNFLAAKELSSQKVVTACSCLTQVLFTSS